MTICKQITVLIFLVNGYNANFILDLHANVQPYNVLPRFWTQTGLSPSAPFPFNRTDVAQQLLSENMYRNMELISALPNGAIKHIRIHWLLSLIDFKGFDANKIPTYDFSALDRFLDHLMEIKLFPVIEFMGDIFPKNEFHDFRFMWKDFTYQFAWHYLSRYGQIKLLNFRFELWNEPDLLTYNILNLTLIEYLDYAHGVASGLEAASRRMNPVSKIPLRGPAGLFKSFEKHQLCYGLLAHCSANESLCPIDIITFHRKGINSPNDILIETIKLLELFRTKYPNLVHMPFANTEADPTSGWSKNVTSYADVHYAHMLVSIVLQHWNSFIKGPLKQLDSISHDNSFLSYHPFEFEQRTMLARFVMNNTKAVHFIQKPVYAALGMLSSLANTATPMEIKSNVSYVLSLGDLYAAVLLSSTKHNQEDHIEIKFDDWHSLSDINFAYFAEFLDQSRTNPFAVWTKYNRPAYPNETVLTEMMHAQGPHILQNPKIIMQLSAKFTVKLSHPWVILVRICASSIPSPSKVKNIRFHSIDKDTILILWHDHEYANYERCIRTYEIFYAPAVEVARNSNSSQISQWELITLNKHIPYMSYCHRVTLPNERLEGYYKVRAVDIFGRFSEFSKVKKFNG
ncbi:alpha-L-iduronidase [Sitodiplosis mosellana]|uniref:alpha-L-iduronidase n=1 Tax=Sitodiplosis mosellana TaxID=263140 RepID=UPI00244424DA|nr:alpha-L-iduronidase [Sitodiplosis mosellana]